jgi:hypothetical protein
MMTWGGLLMSVILTVLYARYVLIPNELAHYHELQKHVYELCRRVPTWAEDEWAGWVRAWCARYQ